MEFLTPPYVLLAVIAFGIIGVYITVDAVSNSIVSAYLKAFHPREGKGSKVPLKTRNEGEGIDYK